MGDMKELFEIMNDEKKERRANNTKNSMEVLLAHGVVFESRNSGAHIIIKHERGNINFWPSTGLWIWPGGKEKRGVFQLIKRLGAKPVDA